MEATGFFCQYYICSCSVAMSLAGCFINPIFSILPPSRLFGLKRVLLRLLGVDVGSQVKVCTPSRFLTTGNVRIGAGTWIGHEFLVVGGESDVCIGPMCDIGPRVTFATGSHEVLVGSHRAAGPGYSKDITIETGCWICAGSTILGGSTIGHCSIVAAGAVVKGVFPPRSMIGGVPARIIRSIE